MVVVRWWCCQVARLFIGKVDEETGVILLYDIVVLHDSHNIIISCSLHADT